MKNIFWKIIAVFFAVLAYYQIKSLIPESSKYDRDVMREEARKNYKEDSKNDYKTNYESKRSQENNWYEGGDLHKSYVMDWRTASYKNKLATCADWMAVVDNTISMSELKTRAENLVICVDEAVATDSKGQQISGTLKTADIAVSCVQILF